MLKKRYWIKPTEVGVCLDGHTAYSFGETKVSLSDEFKTKNNGCEGVECELDPLATNPFGWAGVKVDGLYFFVPRLSLFELEVRLPEFRVVEHGGQFGAVYPGPVFSHTKWFDERNQAVWFLDKQRIAALPDLPTGTGVWRYEGHQKLAEEGVTNVKKSEAYSRQLLSQSP